MVPASLHELILCPSHRQNTIKGFVTYRDNMINDKRKTYT